MLTDQKFQWLVTVGTALGLEHEETSTLISQISRSKRLVSYRDGKLPSVRTKKLLEGGEICHREEQVRFVWNTGTQEKESIGDLIVTSQRIIFVSSTRSFEFSPSAVMETQCLSGSLRLLCLKQSGTGNYFCRDAEELEAVITGVAKIHKYLTNTGSPSTMGRHIPDSVRREVYHRDHGRCIKCGAGDYLECDHIIPHSKGGDNTVKNLQLLCRRCNNQKSDRI